MTSGWMLAVGGLGAFIVGLSKTGIPGAGILCVALFAVVYPTFNSVGIILPLLIVGDLLAVGTYHHHASWKHLLRLFPWTAAGVILGWRAIKELPEDKKGIGPLIGGILLLLIAIHVYREWRKSKKAPAEGASGTVPDVEPDHGPLFTPAMGLLAGFTTMVANAAGPIMILYLLAMRLPKMEFIGTTAWFFLCLNLFKVPFNVDAQMINAESFEVTWRLAAFVVLGGVTGRLAIGHINQKWFERLALWLTPVAAVYLFFKRN